MKKTVDQRAFVTRPTMAAHETDHRKAATCLTSNFERAKPKKDDGFGFWAFAMMATSSPGALTLDS